MPEMKSPEEQLVFDLRWENREVLKHMGRVQRELDRRYMDPLRKAESEWLDAIE